MEDVIEPLTNCMLVDWLGPDATRKSVNGGAAKLFPAVVPPSENVISNCSPTDTLFLSTDAVKEGFWASADHALRAIIAVLIVKSLVVRDLMWRSYQSFSTLTRAGTFLCSFFWMFFSSLFKASRILAASSLEICCFFCCACF